MPISTGDLAVSISVSRTGTLINQRRSQRVLLSVRVEVSGLRPDGSAFKESTATVVVNAHGALVPVRESVHLNQVLSLKNDVTGDKAECIVRDLNLGEGGVFGVGLEFTEPNPRFWRVSFPPADWTARSPEAKRFTAPIAPAHKPDKQT